MAIFQRTLTATITTATLLSSFALSANAHVERPHPRHTHAMEQTQQHGPRSEHLKTILQLQPQQQAAWDQYVKAITPVPRAHAPGERAELRNLTTPQRLDLKQKLRKERMAQVEQREQATRTFYSSLTASQQKAFDTLTAFRASPAKTGHRGPQNKPHQYHGTTAPVHAERSLAAPQ